jgi:hypothetical protein
MMNKGKGNAPPGALFENGFAERRFTCPATRRIPLAVATGAGGTAVAVWFEEIAMFGDEILALISLPIMAGLIYLLDILIFKSRMPRREDLENPYDRGAKK